MGHIDCFPAIASRKKSSKEGTSRPAKSNGSEWSHGISRRLANLASGNSQKGFVSAAKRIEDVAAIRIQTAFRAFLARRTLYHLRCAGRFQSLTQGLPAIQQVSTTLGYLHSWSRIQAQIRDRRIRMVTEARMKQKKLENQSKFEERLRMLRAGWCGGSGTMEDIITRLQRREEAAFKRERALAYAFSHQWRPNSTQYPYFGQGFQCLDKDIWGWSWYDRWVAVRPWEVRVQLNSTVKQPRKPGKLHHVP